MSDASLPVRRALYLALTLRLEKEEAMQAVDLWQPLIGHEHNPLVGLRRYSQEVALRFGLQGREAELHLSLIKSLKMQGLVGGLADAPDSSPPAMNTPASPSAAATSTPATQLLEKFIQAIEMQVSKDAKLQYTPDRWRQSLLQQIKQHKSLDAALIQNWLNGQTASLQGHWPARKQGTQLINALYVVLAQWVGPVKADACFMETVNSFEHGANPLLRDIRNYL
jgi:hypothetical protein